MLRFSRSLRAILVACILFQVHNSDAQLLQQFSFSGSTGTEANFPPNGQPVNGSIGNMRRGSGISGSSGVGAFSATGFTTQATLDTADYFSFSIRANTGFQLNLDSIVFGQRKSNSGPANYSVRSSRDGFLADLLSGAASNSITYNNKVSLGAGFTGVAASENIDFRFFGFGAGNIAGTWRLDSVRIYGSISSGGVVIPKPKLVFSTNSFTFNESTGAQAALLQFSAQPSVEVSGALFVKSGTANAGSDYEGFDSIAFTFTPGGSLSFSKSVNFLDDPLAEPGENLVLVARKTGLPSDTAYELGPDSLFTFNITDNDLPPSGALLQKFNFTGAAGDEASFPPDGQPANGAIGNMKRGSGLSPNAAGNVFSATGFTTQATLDTADYFAFSLGSNSGFQLNLDSIVFGQRKSNTGPANFSVRSSLDGFQSDLLTAATTTLITYNNKVSLGSAFQALSSAQAVEFRFFGFSSGNISGTWRLDSVRIYGSITPGGGVVSKPKLRFLPNSLTFTESTSSQTASLQFSAQPSVEVSGALFVKSGTANAGSDYEGFDSIAFAFTPGGSLSFSKSVNFLDDALAEPGENLVLVARKTGLPSDTAYELGPDSLFTFNITDNDLPPSGAQLQKFNFTGAAGDEASFPPDGQPANGAIGNMKRGSGLSPNAAGNVFSATGFTTQATLDTADYFSFSIRSDQGYQLNIDSIVFGQRRSPTGPSEFAVRSSLDGFQSTLASGPTGVLFNWGNRVITGTSFEAISSDQVVEFRFFGFGSGNTTGTWRLDSVRIYGSITPGGGVVSKPKLRFLPNSLTFAESNGPRSASLQFSSQPSVEVSGALFAKSGTANAGSDYEGFASIPFTLTPGGSLSFSKSVNFLDDALSETGENLVLVARKTGLPSDTAYDLGPDSLFTFNITDNDAPAPAGLPTRTIGQIRGNNTGNQADSTGKSFRIFGTIYGLNQRLSATGGGYQMFIRDATGGLGIFKNAAVSGIPSLNEGDSVRVMGKIECFRGQSQMVPDSMVLIATGRPIKTPDLVTAINEQQESNLVRMVNLSINPATWTTGTGIGGFTVRAFNGSDSVSIRIDNDCPLYNQPAPSGSFTLVAMVGQFVAGNPAPVAPFPSTGYQLIPRKTADLTVTTRLNSSLHAEDAWMLSPNPGTGSIRVSGRDNASDVLSIFDLMGRPVLETLIPAGSASLNLSDYPDGVYFFRFQNSAQMIRWVKSSR